MNGRKLIKFDFKKDSGINVTLTNFEYMQGNLNKCAQNLPHSHQSLVQPPDLHLNDSHQSPRVNQHFHNWKTTLANQRVETQIQVSIMKFATRSSFGVFVTERVWNIRLCGGFLQAKDRGLCDTHQQSLMESELQISCKAPDH